MQIKFKIYLLFFLITVPLCVWAQKDSIVTLPIIVHSTGLRPVVVTGIADVDRKNTSLNIEPVQLKKLEENSPYNLSDALARIPGVSQMTTGIAISKPVIRGLYGNRVLVLLSGLRFDNQQWQDEHGLGLSQIGIDRIELIKGPASLLYGTDAIGGVINIIEEKPTMQGTTVDFGTRFFSNTLGTLTDVGIKQRKENKWWRVRTGYENHGDYSDGKNNRVLNSRNRGYYLKAGYGFVRNNWHQENSYNFSYNQYGFILDDLGSFFQPDVRWSRAMEGPHHNVILNTFSSQNTFFLKDESILKLNAGIQSNVRMEDEGGGQISLNMHLFSVLENLKWEKKLGRTTRFIGNQQFTFENNTNYGGRIIVPDANMFENNLSGFFRFGQGLVVLETGIGINHKFIQTFETRTQNTPDKEILPFKTNKLAGDVMLGITVNPSEYINIKSNISTGTRAGNLAELASNGLHEGIFRYEIGDPDLKPEQNINADLSIDCNRFWYHFTLSGFYNRFYNYIYLAPTSEQFFGFQVFRYKQQNAYITGGEAALTIKPMYSDWIQWKSGFTSTYGKLDEGGYLPFIPALKINSSVRLQTGWNTGKYYGKGNRKDMYIEPGVDYVFAQNRAAAFETNTPAYFLLNLNAGLTKQVGKTEMQFTLSGKNLLNRQYADHLSRLKYYGLYNPGINIVFSVKIKLDL